ncbi:hypothetical protein F4823DRAFT_588550, partial [Ustulina deusta]
MGGAASLMVEPQRDRNVVACPSKALSMLTAMPPLMCCNSLAGLKSLSPSPMMSRHCVAGITDSEVVFNRIIVAKYKRVVLL